MDFLKQIVILAEGEEPKTPVEIIAHMEKVLKGEKVTAFGPNGKGLWGRSDEEKQFEISKLQGHYFDVAIGGKLVGTLDVHLTDYHSKDNGLIYTDKTFEKSLKALLKEKGLMRFIKDIGYSEQGMQGKNYVNFDIEFKVPKK